MALRDGDGGRLTLVISPFHSSTGVGQLSISASALWELEASLARAAGACRATLSCLGSFA